MRITNHPILEFEAGEEVSFIFEGELLKGRSTDTIASALIANGYKVFGHHYVTGRPKGIYCAIGNCSSCLVNVNGKPNIRACITKLEPNMQVLMQDDKGQFNEES